MTDFVLSSGRLSKALSKAVTNQNSEARDHLANERTFLAWTRTAIAFIAFGLVVVKFVRTRGGGITGTIMLVLGAALIPAAGARYYHVQKALEEGNFSINTGGIALFLALTVVASVSCIVVVIAGLYS